MDRFGVLLFRDEQIDDGHQIDFNRSLGPIEQATGGIGAPEDRRLGLDLTEIFNLEKNERVLAGLILGVVVAIRVLAHVRPQRALLKGTRRLRSTTRLTKGRIDGRASILDHAQWPQDHNFP